MYNRNIYECITTTLSLIPRITSALGDKKKVRTQAKSKNARRVAHSLKVNVGANVRQIVQKIREKVRQLIPKFNRTQKKSKVLPND